MNNLHNQLREALYEESKSLNPSPELKVKVMSTITTNRGKRKKHLITSVLIASLLLPTSAFAYQSFLADDLYGSFEQVKKHLANATMEGYLLFDAKLSQAKGELGKEEYADFKELLHVVTESKLDYGDANGNIDYDQLPSRKIAELKTAFMEIQPYFDKLNGLVSSEKLLTAEEYETYIEALMTYEKIAVQSGSENGSVNVDDLPANLQAEFQDARDFMDYVNEMQIQ
ncbi:DUF3600 domain-containing protein [Peribacillus simplex]|uniref:DUF3600 domain-containing protein n=1 Tax=Peribacillus simplex TaxID=1478 RepID=UPI0025A165DE|nr:DUF3600 domain-containing protein [Peribacillus simplex]MDM5292737.1 DUF3600 domain-containing protein [Peribacillus simplex]